MKERKQKTLSQVNGCPQRDRSETEWYGGVQTFMWMCEDNIVEVPFDKEHLFEQILSPANLNRAYKAVMRNKGCGSIDKMSCEQLLPWLLTNKDELIRSLMDGSYRLNPVKRVEIPKDNDKRRLSGQSYTQISPKWCNEQRLVRSERGRDSPRRTAKSVVE